MKPTWKICADCELWSREWGAANRCREGDLVKIYYYYYYQLNDTEAITQWILLIAGFLCWQSLLDYLLFRYSSYESIFGHSLSFLALDCPLLHFGCTWMLSILVRNEKIFHQNRLVYVLSANTRMQ